jgi:hypothetical protein
MQCLHLPLQAQLRPNHMGHLLPTQVSISGTCQLDACESSVNTLYIHTNGVMHISSLLDSRRPLRSHYCGYHHVRTRGA